MAGAGGIPLLVRLQLIVFFLPMQADAGEEQRLNRGAGYLHVECGSSPLELLHNMKVFIGKRSWESSVCRPEQSAESVSHIICHGKESPRMLPEMA